MATGAGKRAGTACRSAPGRPSRRSLVGLAALLASASFPAAAADTAADDVRELITRQERQLDVLRRSLAAQQAELDALRAQVEGRRPAPVPPPTPAAPSMPPDAPVSPPQVAAIFEQPGVLTPAGRFSLEPSLQYSYSSSSRVALVGYTVIPAILVGVIDVREVKRTTLTGALALRYGLTNRFELEAKLPYVYRYDTSLGREVLVGSSTDSAVFDAQGKGVGDVEVTARYQLNDGGADRPFYVGSLRIKSRTGTDPFHIPVSTTVKGFSGDGIETALPTGSGFYGVQPALTVLYPSDPAVLFGTVSYLHSLTRHGVTRATDQGPQPLGTVAPGGIFGFNLGLGVALNEKSSFSIGYDHSSVGKTRLNGTVAPESVRLELGTLLLGYALRLDDRRSVNLSLGAGLTRDTPDVTLTLRLPMSF